MARGRKITLAILSGLALVSGGLGFFMAAQGLPSDEVGSVLTGAAIVILLWICGICSSLVILISVWSRKTFRYGFLLFLCILALSVGVWVYTDGLWDNPFRG